MRVIQFAAAEVAGGLLAHVGILVEGLAGSGHEVAVVLSPARGADGAARRCARAGAAVTRLAVRGKTDLRGFARLSSQMRRVSPDIVHLHLSSPVEAMPAILAARFGGARGVVTTEHAPTWAPRRRAYSRVAKRAVARGLDAVIAVCESDARYLRETYGVPERLLTVIPNGVAGFSSPPDRSAARARLGLGAAGGPATVIGYVGALEPKKGILDLLEAAGACAVPGIALALAGEGSLRPELRRRAESLPFPIVMPGPVDDVGGFLAALDIFVLPSHQEALPLALLEAMWSGLPVIATRVGGVPEALEQGRGGILVDAARPDQIAAAISRLAREPALARRLGDRAAVSAREHHGAERMVRCVESLYMRILGGAAIARAGG